MARTPFKLKSGNSPLYKKLGSSPKNIGGGEKSIKKITDEGHKEYMEKGSKHFPEIAKKTGEKVQQAKSYNKSRANYLKYAASIAPTATQASKSKGTLIDSNNPNVKHDDIIIDTWGGKVNVSKSARKKITK